MTDVPGEHGHRIVVGMDGSDPSKAALRWGIEQADRTGAFVQAIIAYYWFPMPIQEIDFKAVAEDLLSEEIREVARYEADVKIVTRALRGDPARVLIDASCGADLLVVGNKGRSGIAGALLGSASQYCVQHATCPVAVLRDTDVVGDREPRIVVGVNGSRSSKAALAWAMRQAAVTGMIVDAVIAWQVPTYYGYSLAAGGLEDADLAGIAARTVQDVIEQVGGGGTQVEVTSSVVRGDAAQVLLKASERAALLVTGNRGHSVLGEALIGSVSQRCTHHATCPVVIVRDGRLQ